MLKDGESAPWMKGTGSTAMTEELADVSWLIRFQGDN